MTRPGPHRANASAMLDDVEGAVMEARDLRRRAGALGGEMSVSPEAVLMLGLALGHALLAIEERLDAIARHTDPDVGG